MKKLVIYLVCEPETPALAQAAVDGGAERQVGAEAHRRDEAQQQRGDEGPCRGARVRHHHGRG